jgi:hypothetical protein
LNLKKIKKPNLSWALKIFYICQSSEPENNNGPKIAEKTTQQKMMHTTINFTSLDKEHHIKIIAARTNIHHPSWVKKINRKKERNNFPITLKIFFIVLFFKV